MEVNFNNGISWGQAEVQENTRLTHTGDVGTYKNVTELDEVWHGSFSDNQTLEPSALTQTVFGETITISFDKICGIAIKNKSLAVDETISVTIPFIFSGTITIQADSTLCFNNMQGWTPDDISITATTPYEVCIVGLK